MVNEKGGKNKGSAIFDIIVIVAFTISSVASFYTFGCLSVDISYMFNILFSMSIIDNILSIINSLIPFFLLFPLPFSIIAVYGIKREHFNFIIPLMASVLSILFGLLIFNINLTYMLFSISFIIGSIICSYWSHTRYRELKFMKIYRATTTSSSKAFLMIKIGIIVAIFISLQSNEARIEKFIDNGIDSLSILSIKIGEKQLKSQVEGGVKAQSNIQKEMISNLTTSIGNFIKIKGIKKIDEIKEKELQSIDKLNIPNEIKNEIRDYIGNMLDKERQNWNDEIDNEIKRMLYQISKRFEDESYQKQLIEEYEDKLKKEMLTKEKVREQIENLLREEIDIEGKGIVMYDIVKTTLPIIIILILLAIIDIWKKLIFLPLVGIYSLILTKGIKIEGDDEV